MADAPMTVVETERFLKDVESLMPDADREKLVAFVGANPEAGKIVPETGGVRKLRWALAGSKNEKANLSKAERNAMKRLVQTLVAGYPVKK